MRVKPLFHDLPIQLNSMLGKIISELAKMIGMTPPWLIRSGTKCRPPAVIRRPRTCLAC